MVNPSPDTFSPTGWKDGGGLDLIYAANEHRALMIEMGGGPVDETQLEKALALAHKHVSERKSRGKRGGGDRGGGKVRWLERGLAAGGLYESVECETRRTGKEIQERIGHM